MPTPSSRMESACSNTSQSMPRARNISAVVKPPMPPPTIIAFIALTPHAGGRVTPKAIGSHGPSLRRKRLCRLRLELRPCLRLSLNPQVLEILPVTDAVAEDLLLAGQILRRAEQAVGAVPGGRLHGERGVDEVRAPQRHEIGAASCEDGVDLIG